MSLKANLIGLLAIPLLMTACAGSNGFESLQTQEADTSGLNATFDDLHLPTQKATVDPNAGKNNEAPVVTPSAPTSTDVKATVPATSNTPAVNPLRAGDIAEVGFLKPTIYYFPVYNEDAKGCAASEKVNLHDEDGKTLMQVCRKSSDSCSLQGSCSIIQKGKARIFNILTRIRGQDRYFEMDRDECRFGLGVRSICLDPFYTLAADLKIYKPGDVIFVPSVVGAVLPSGTLHDGFFIVRDAGRAIKGRGRFDFFTGLVGWNDGQNPFAKLGLGDKKNTMRYFKVQGQKAQEILSRRMFPQLPIKATH